MSRFGLAGILLLLPLCSFARDITDSIGEQVRINDQPQRVVALIPSLAELTADLLDHSLEKIVGVSEFSDYPPALKKFASVGPYNRVSIEKIVSLRPDLVLASFNGNAKEQVAHLRELKIPVVVVKTDTFDEVEESMRLIGAALGRKEQGAAMAQAFRTGISKIKARGKTRTSVPKVMLQVGDSPLVVAGGENILNECLGAVGAENIYSDSRLSYPRPSVEDVLHRRPDAILVLQLSDSASSRASAARWDEFKKIPAVANSKVAIIADQGLLRPTLRMIEGLLLLEKRIWGEQ
ncbi:MAG: hypothetical protein A2Z97_03845 [Bdellovibrionales bacterium GWB1_52_6]|nr:MAG: hypothetical protein A2Z97_03845 [Bdellovibrionales bacterium GWB1_52_6]